MKHVIFLLTWWRVLPHKSLSSLDKDFMDLLTSEQESLMDDPVNNWFQRESPPPCRCCEFVGAHYDHFISPPETTFDLEPTKLITATNEVDLSNFLTLDVVLCQPVGTPPANSTCFMGAVKQRETAIDLKHCEQIAGKIFQATASGQDWFSQVVDFGASRTSTPSQE